MPVIPATQEAETGRIIVWGQQVQKVRETPSQQINGVWWHVSVIPPGQEAIGRRIMVSGQPWTKHKTLSEK
jgi:hypothetical protein